MHTECVRDEGGGSSRGMLFLPSFPFLPSSLPTSSFHLSPHPFLPPSLQPLSIPLSSHFPPLPQGSLERLLLRFTAPVNCLVVINSHSFLAPSQFSIKIWWMWGTLYVCMHSPHLLHLFILLLPLLYPLLTLPHTHPSPFPPLHSPPMHTHP